MSFCCNVVHIQQLPTTISIENTGITAARCGFTGDSGIVPHTQTRIIFRTAFIQSDFNLSTVTSPAVITQTSNRFRCFMESPIQWNAALCDALAENIAILIRMNQLECTTLVCCIPWCATTHHNFIFPIAKCVFIRQRQPLRIGNVMRKCLHTVDPTRIQRCNGHDALRWHFDEISLTVFVAGLYRLSTTEPVCRIGFSRIRTGCNDRRENAIGESHIFQLYRICTWEQVFVGEVHCHFCPFR